MCCCCFCSTDVCSVLIFCNECTSAALSDLFIAIICNVTDWNSILCDFIVFHLNGRKWIIGEFKIPQCTLINDSWYMLMQPWSRTASALDAFGPWICLQLTTKLHHHLHDSSLHQPPQDSQVDSKWASLRLNSWLQRGCAWCVEPNPLSHRSLTSSHQLITLPTLSLTLFGNTGLEPVNAAQQPLTRAWVKES